MKVERNLPQHVKYWLSATSKNDCFFVLKSELGHTVRIGAMKVFLCAYSEPLRNMLENSELAEQNDVKIEDVEAGTFWTFLKCLYGGSDFVIPKLSCEESISLLYVMEKYLVTEIKPKVVFHILQLLPLVFENIFSTMSSQVCFLDESLEEAIMEIVALKTKEIFTSELFLQLSSVSVLRIVKADYLNTSETDVWDAVVKWARHTAESGDGKVLRNLLRPHLKFIRICTFSCEDFCRKVVSTDILTCEEVNEISKYFGTGIAPQLEFICDSTYPRCNAVTEKTFYHIVNDISELKSIGYKSQSFTFVNYSWNILVQKRDDNLALFVACNGNSDDLTWKTNINAEISLVNQERDQNFSRRFTHCFCNDEDDWGWKNFLTWDVLTDGYVKDNTIIVKVHLKIDSNQKEID
uniref:BTB domain-containing protein n=1 Tax=Cuerna arida TaxID=1464854 RepID=A0A1B6F7N6_9HEMI